MEEVDRHLEVNVRPQQDILDPQTSVNAVQPAKQARQGDGLVEWLSYLLPRLKILGVSSLVFPCVFGSFRDVLKCRYRILGVILEDDIA